MAIDTGKKKRTHSLPKQLKNLTRPLSIVVAPSFHVTSGSEELMRLLPGRRGSSDESSHVSLLFEEGSDAIEEALTSVFRGYPEEVAPVALREVGPARVTLMPTRDVTGRISGAVLVVYPGPSESRDVSKAAPMEPGGQEHCQFLNATGELFAFLEPDLSIRWANKAAANSVGAPADDLTGLKCYQVFHGRTTPCESCPVLKAAETLAPQESEVVMADGRRFALRSYPITNSEGGLSGLVEFGRDITTERNTEEALRRTAGLLESILENSPDPISVLDTDGNYTLVNQATSRLYGLPRESLLGHHLTEFLPEETGALFHRRIQRVVREKRPVTVEDEIGEDDKVGVFYTTLFPIWDEKGDVTAIGGITTDVTELKSSQEKAERADAQKSRLLSEVHNRVKNNLQMISSLINLSSHPDLPEESRDVLHQTQARIRALSLAHERVRDAEDFGAVDLASYSQSLVSEIIQTHSCANSVSLSLWSDPLVVPLDFGVSFGIILNELVANVCKHAFVPDQGGLLEVAISDNARSVTLRVSDNGPGLPEEIPEGMGLFIVRSLVDHLGGSLELDASDGTAWMVTLGLAPEDRLPVY